MNYRITHFALGSMLAAALLAPLAAGAQVSISVSIAPPPLLAYAQPAIPGDGYIWTPGYWAWSPRDHAYYWVPGTWVLAPAPGYLWTPGYWAFENGLYLWHLGYWGTRVGFYGGINYGYGYGGYGYDGGRWNGSVFSYNRVYNNVSPTVVQSMYSTRAGSGYRAGNAPHVSFNGGRGGVTARPTAAQIQAQRATHSAPTSVQAEHERTALSTPTQRAAARGAPQIVATPKPSAFTEPRAVRSRNTAAARAAPAAREQQGRSAPAVEQRAQRQERVEQRADQRVERAPRAEQRVERAPRTEQRVERAPRVEQRVERAPRVEPRGERQVMGAPAQPHQPRAERGQPGGGRGEGRGQGHGKDKDR
ncbi:MAG: hypothetical protein ACAH21_14025 [Ramlibacter sp.]